MTQNKGELALAYRRWIELARLRGGLVRAAFAREVRAEVKRRLPAVGDEAIAALRESYFPTDAQGRRDVPRQKARESAKYTSWTRETPGPSVPSHPIEREALIAVVGRYAADPPQGVRSGVSFRDILEALAGEREQASADYVRLVREAADRRRAERWTSVLAEPAEAAQPEAMYRLGRLAREEGDVAAARSWFEEASRLGHAGAMFERGELAHEDGDVAEARRWWERAARQRSDAPREAHGTTTGEVR